MCDKSKQLWMWSKNLHLIILSSFDIYWDIFKEFCFRYSKNKLEKGPQFTWKTYSLWHKRDGQIKVRWKYLSHLRFPLLDNVFVVKLLPYRFFERWKAPFRVRGETQWNWKWGVIKVTLSQEQRPPTSESREDWICLRGNTTVSRCRPFVSYFCLMN